MTIAKRNTLKTTRFEPISPRSGPLVAVVLALFALSGAAHAGGLVRGRLAGFDKLVPTVYAEMAKVEAHRYTWRDLSPTVRPEFRVLSASPSRDLCIAAMTNGTAPAHDPVLVKVTGGHTIPTTLVVTPGTRLAFENRDPFKHRLYALGQAAFKADDMMPSARREWTAPSAGAFEFRDELAPSLRLYIVVDPQVVAFAFPARDGAFQFDLPPGEYTLKSFFNGREVGKPTAVVVKEKVAIELKDPVNVAETAK